MIKLKDLLEIQTNNPKKIKVRGYMNQGTATQEYEIVDSRMTNWFGYEYHDSAMISFDGNSDIPEEFKKLGFGEFIINPSKVVIPLKYLEVIHKVDEIQINNRFQLIEVRIEGDQVTITDDRFNHRWVGRYINNNNLVRFGGTSRLVDDFIKNGYSKYVVSDTLIHIPKILLKFNNKINENLQSHAQQELTLAGLLDKDSDYGGMIGKAVLELMQTFSKQGHSGFSAAWVREVFNKLSNYETLTPITSKPEEWINVCEMSEEPLWQNSRNPAVFSKDGGKTFYHVDGKTINEGIKIALQQYKLLNEIQISNILQFPIKLENPYQATQIGKKLEKYKFKWESELELLHTDRIFHLLDDEYPIYLNLIDKKNKKITWTSLPPESYIEEIQITKPPRLWDFTKYIPNLDLTKVKVGDTIITSSHRCDVEEIEHFFDDGLFFSSKGLGFTAQQLEKVNEKNRKKESFRGSNLTIQKVREQNNQGFPKDKPRIKLNAAYVRQHYKLKKADDFVKKVVDAVEKQGNLATLRQNQLIQNYLTGQKYNDVYSTKNENLGEIQITNPAPPLYVRKSIDGRDTVYVNSKKNKNNFNASWGGSPKENSYMFVTRFKGDMYDEFVKAGYEQFYKEGEGFLIPTKLIRYE